MFSIQRVKVLTPHVSRIHCRLTREGRWFDPSRDHKVRAIGGPCEQVHNIGGLVDGRYVIARRSGGVTIAMTVAHIGIGLWTWPKATGFG